MVTIFIDKPHFGSHEQILADPQMDPSGTLNGT